jgi:acetylornithine deacetylase
MTDRVEAVVAKVDELSADLLEALSAAIQIQSVSPRYPGQRYEDHVGREGDVARLMASLYERAGCEIDLFAIEEGRENCVGVLRGGGSGRSLIFNGHMDVVPAGNLRDWERDPWSGEIAGGAVYGRGAADMKGGIVAQAFAAIALRELGVQLEGDLILESVVGEETGEHILGTTACLERGYRADAAIVSEPSAPPVRLGIVAATPGTIGFSVTIDGRSGHAGMRGETIHPGGAGERAGVNAIDKAVLVYAGFRQLEEEWGLTKRHPLFQPGQFSIHPGIFKGAPTEIEVPFVIPDRARIDYIAKYAPGEDANEVRKELERQLNATAELDGWLRRNRPTISWDYEWPPSAVPEDSPLVECLEAATEVALGSRAPVTGWSGVHEGTFFNNAGIPAVAFGPGDLRNAHAANEFVPVADLIDAAKAYAVFALDWCGEV